MPDTPVTRRLSRQRLLVCDIVAAGLRVPSFPVDRWIDLASVAAARQSATVRVGWAAIFVKAYAIVAREMPALRSWYVPGLLWPRKATSKESVATVSVNRRIDGDDTLYWIQLTAPDSRPLTELQETITWHATQPVEVAFSRQLQLAGLPGWLRRAVLSWNLQTASRKRAKRMGTFSLSTLAGHAAFNRLHPSPLTTSLSYGPLAADGRALVTVQADHRLLDGVPVARALERLDHVLQTEILGELQGMSAQHQKPLAAA
jgi:hypothetical protein